MLKGILHDDSEFGVLAIAIWQPHQPSYADNLRYSRGLVLVLGYEYELASGIGMTNVLQSLVSGAGAERQQIGSYCSFFARNSPNWG